jgi:hypothetical protein
LAKLLVLSLAETQRDPLTGYAVIARNLENNSWVIIPTLPKRLLRIDNEYAWDIFGVTEVDLRRRIGARSDIYEVDTDNYQPRMISPPIKSNRERKRILEELSNDSITELTDSTSWAGILKNPVITGMEFYKRKEDDYNYDPNQTFYWECRLDFADVRGYKWKYKIAPGVAVKDMRFKSYWRDVCILREDKFEESKEKWIRYMTNNTTYLLVEFYPNQYYGTIAVVSGIFTLND